MAQQTEDLGTWWCLKWNWPYWSKALVIVESIIQGTGYRVPHTRQKLTRLLSGKKKRGQKDGRRFNGPCVPTYSRKQTIQIASANSEEHDRQLLTFGFWITSARLTTGTCWTCGWQANETSALERRCTKTVRKACKASQSEHSAECANLWILWHEIPKGPALKTRIEKQTTGFH